MPYTVHDWFEEHAEVLVRIPDGSPLGYTELWVPFLVLSENNYPDAWGARWPGTLDAEALERLGIKPQRHIPGL